MSAVVVSGEKQENNRREVLFAMVEFYLKGEVRCTKTNDGSVSSFIDCFGFSFLLGCGWTCARAAAL